MSKEILSLYQSGYSHLAGPSYDVEGMAQALSDAADIVNRLNDASRALLAEVVVPDSNCRCHLVAPCNDCVDNGRLREAVAEMNAALAEAQAKLKVQAKA